MMAFFIVLTFVVLHQFRQHRGLWSTSLPISWRAAVVKGHWSPHGMCLHRWHMGSVTGVSRPVVEPTQPLIQWVPWVKRPGREVNHSLPTSAEVWNAWSYTSTHPARLHSVVLS